MIVVVLKWDTLCCVMLWTNFVSFTGYEMFENDDLMSNEKKPQELVAGVSSYQ